MTVLGPKLGLEPPRGAYGAEGQANRPKADVGSGRKLHPACRPRRREALRRRCNSLVMLAALWRRVAPTVSLMT